jgi:transcriptional regulator with XRE-family HTH domain
MQSKTGGGATVTVQVPTPGQLRAARAGLGWNLHDLSSKSGLSRNSLSSYERGRGRPTVSTMLGLKAVYESAGVRFVTVDGCPAVVLPVQEE